MSNRETIAPRTDVPTAVQPEPLDGLPAIQSDRPPALPGERFDAIRDRMRVVGDRVIYACALACATWLKSHGKLDWDVVVFLLLVAGIRPANVLDALTKRGAVPLVIAGLHVSELKRFFGT